MEFLHSFGKVLGFDLTKDVPSLGVLQEGLLCQGDSLGKVQDLLVRLLKAALHDPGLPSHCQVSFTPPPPTPSNGDVAPSCFWLFVLFSLQCFICSFLCLCLWFSIVVFHPFLVTIFHNCPYFIFHGWGCFAFLSVYLVSTCVSGLHKDQKRVVSLVTGVTIVNHYVSSGN